MAPIRPARQAPTWESPSGAAAVVAPGTGYELIDAGAGRRLERFGRYLVDRPATTATAPVLRPDAWLDSDLRFDRDSGWVSLNDGPIEPWTVRLEGLTLELRPTASGQVGIFPDHLASLPWLADRTSEAIVRHGGTPEVLNLFASTGLATLALARAGAAVVHVDASRPTVRWARSNATASGLADRSIRWIVEDARAFCRREVRRGRRYAIVVLDPPSYGHGPTGRGRRIEDDLGELLALVAALLGPDGALLVTSHTPGLTADRLSRLTGHALGEHATLEGGVLDIRARSGARLQLGAFARTTRRG